MALDANTRHAIEAALGHAFKDESLAEQALTHRSMLFEHPELRSNEPLEFLGDAVLGFLVAELLHRRDPNGAEGEKTRMRARLVSTASLVRIGRSFDVGSLILMSAGDERNGGRLQDRAQEDAVEALIAAVYLDGGIRAARRVVLRLVGPVLDEASLATKDPKSALQEFLHSRGPDLPRYEVEAQEGLDHRPSWRCQCLIAGEVLGRGEGSSRKKAEFAAAEQALKTLTLRHAAE